MGGIMDLERKFVEGGSDYFHASRVRRNERMQRIYERKTEQLNLLILQEQLRQSQLATREQEMRLARR